MWQASGRSKRTHQSNANATDYTLHWSCSPGSIYPPGSLPWSHGKPASVGDPEPSRMTAVERSLWRISGRWTKPIKYDFPVASRKWEARRWAPLLLLLLLPLLLPPSTKWSYQIPYSKVAQTLLLKLLTFSSSVGPTSHSRAARLQLLLLLLPLQRPATKKTIGTEVETGNHERAQRRHSWPSSSLTPYALLGFSKAFIKAICGPSEQD